MNVDSFPRHFERCGTFYTIGITGQKSHLGALILLACAIKIKLQEYLRK